MSANEMNELRDDITTYEISFLAKDEADAKKGLDFLRRHGAEITFEGPVEMIRLAYPIRHETSAYFGYAHVTLPKSDVPALTHDLRAQGFFLRVLIVTPPFAKMRPRVSLRPRAHEAVGAPPVSLERPSASSLPLSNEALEKKIEEILKE